MDWLFQGWAGIGRTLLVGVLAYVGLVLILRVSGKRTLSKMNAFDLVVTVALGSTLATILLSADTALVEGITAFAVLVGMQFVVTWTSVRSETVSRLVKDEPTALLYRGRLLPKAMRRTRVLPVEVDQALRAAGLTERDDAEAVVLETDGTFSVIPRSRGAGGAIEDVAGVDADAAGGSGGDPRSRAGSG